MRLNLQMSQELVELLDRERGDVPRSVYVGYVLEGYFEGSNPVAIQRRIEAEGTIERGWPGSLRSD